MFDISTIVKRALISLTTAAFSGLPGCGLESSRPAGGGGHLAGTGQWEGMGEGRGGGRLAIYGLMGGADGRSASGPISRRRQRPWRGRVLLRAGLGQGASIDGERSRRPTVERPGRQAALPGRRSYQASLCFRNDGDILTAERPWIEPGPTAVPEIRARPGLKTEAAGLMRKALEKSDNNAFKDLLPGLLWCWKYAGWV